ncbi:ABC transporter permease [Jiangella gansuensis]|uniref:ABC transporter permease n=1 Tax=Jiangella gansuensis TaxID=281473 RepID=UPI0004B79B7D|nr:ABC transporter permease [Jiangella gansuensis]
MTAPTTERTRADRARSVARRQARRHGWTVGVWLLLVVMLVWYATLIPQFGDFQLTSIAKNSLPTVFLALAQAVIVIAGGIDVGIGALMVLANSVAARLMEGQPFVVTVAIGLGVVVGSALLNGLVGWTIVRSGVPDVVVTLATLFIFTGLALLVLSSPGGGTSPGLRLMFTGSETGVGSNYVPSLLALAIPAIILSWWLTRTRRGLALYAIGSDTSAAFLSGIDVGRAKIRSYAVGGAFAGLAGVALVAISNSGDPRFVNALNGTLNSLAAVVLGGVLLGGGVGSVIGATAAGIMLFTLNPVLTAMGIDPNTAQIVRGALIVAVMMAAGLLEWRRRRRT